MGLSSQQIERYSRQIIVPGVGGIAQERLLASRLMLAGKAADVASIFGYLVGAGIGEIRLLLPPSEAAQQDSLMMHGRQLNPAVAIRAANENVAGLDLILAMGGDPEITELIPLPQLQSTGVPIIFTRLDEPGVIAILSGTSPCLSCADAELLVPLSQRGENGGFVAMIAATEAFKFLANLAPAPAPTLLVFSGFACTTRQLRQKPTAAACGCSNKTGEKHA
jgi:hypothetical protein